MRQVEIKHIPGYPPLPPGEKRCDTPATLLRTVERRSQNTFDSLHSISYRSKRAIKNTKPTKRGKGRAEKICTSKYRVAHPQMTALLKYDSVYCSSLPSHVCIRSWPSAPPERIRFVLGQSTDSTLSSCPVMLWIGMVRLRMSQSLMLFPLSSYEPDTS